MIYNFVGATAKLQNQQFGRRICKNRILAASDYCLHKPIKVS